MPIVTNMIDVPREEDPVFDARFIATYFNYVDDEARSVVHDSEPEAQDVLDDVEENEVFVSLVEVEGKSAD